MIYRPKQDDELAEIVTKFNENYVRRFGIAERERTVAELQSLIEQKKSELIKSTFEHMLPVDLDKCVKLLQKVETKKTNARRQVVKVK